MEFFAPDTNFFLQCLPADQVSWRLVTDDDEVTLIVVREVRKELDRLKAGGNQRRSKRARTVSALFRRFTSSAVEEIELRPSGPRVVLRAAPRAPTEALPKDFPIESSDERIVAETFVVGTGIDHGITFLSHDTVPLEDAAALGLRTKVIPDEWLLDAEPSEVERELVDLRRRMKTLEGRSPNIRIAVPLSPEDRIVLELPYFPPLSDDFIASALRRVRAKHFLGPSGEHSHRIGRTIAALEGIDESRWIAYAESYTAWISNVEELLLGVSNHLNSRSTPAELSLAVQNAGSIGAENLIIRIEPLGEFHLLDPGEGEPDGSDSQSYFPAPPKRPRPKLIEDFFSAERLPGYDSAARLPEFVMPRISTPRIARDRHTIYWEYDDDVRAKYVEGQCEDFRHGLSPADLVLQIKRNEPGEAPLRGGLRILISAGNLPEVVTITHHTDLGVKVTSTENAVRALLFQDLGVEL